MIYFDKKKKKAFEMRTNFLHTKHKMNCERSRD